MRPITNKDLRFKLKYGLMQISRQTLKDLSGSSDKRERALDLATDILIDQMKGWQFEAPDPLGPH